MDSNNTQVIGEMYTLFRQVSGLKPLHKAFRDYVQKGVETIVKDASKDDEMVPRLLKHKSEADNIISKAFLAPTPASQKQSSTSKLPANQRDPRFVTALNDAFTYGFRARRSKPAEMIARYLHQQLRKGQKNMNDGEYQAGLDAALALYRFSEDKDVFRTFYHRSLAKRLLQGSSASDDFEAAMLKKLKEREWFYVLSTFPSQRLKSPLAEYDPDFGMGESMFKDLNVSKDLMRAYHETLKPDSSALKLTVTVLQHSGWPFTAPNQVVNLPPDMQEDVSKFERYYKGKHAGRVLYWDHALGNAVLKARFKAGMKDLALNLHQALVLLEFNREDEISFMDLKERLLLGTSSHHIFTSRFWLNTYTCR